MNISRRAQYLRNLIEKEAALRTPSPPSSIKANLFPKLEGPNKPPVLTPNNQPKINLNEPPKETSLPRVSVKGKRPKFTSTMNSGNPY